MVAIAAPQHDSTELRDHAQSALRHVGAGVADSTRTATQASNVAPVGSHLSLPVFCDGTFGRGDVARTCCDTRRTCRNNEPEVHPIAPRPIGNRTLAHRVQAYDSRLHSDAARRGQDRPIGFLRQVEGEPANLDAWCREVTVATRPANSGFNPATDSHHLRLAAKVPEGRRGCSV